MPNLNINDKEWVTKGNKWVLLCVSKNERDKIMSDYNARNKQ